MHLFIDNWSATLLAPITDTSLSISIEPSKAALLVGLGSGDVYQLTLVEANEAGIEIGWEVVSVTAQSAGTLNIGRGAGARAWSAGAVIEARLTAAALAQLRGSSYLSRATYLDRVRAGALGSIRPAMLCAHPEFGAFVSVEAQLLLPWVGETTQRGADGVDLCDSGVAFGHAADGPGTYGWRRDAGVLRLVTGDSSDVGVGMGAKVSAGFPLAGVASAVASISFVTPDVLSTSAEKYELVGTLMLPGLGTLSYAYRNDWNAGKWRLTLQSPVLGTVVINTAVTVLASASVVIAMTLAGSDVNFSIDGAVVASRTVVQMTDPAAEFLGADVSIIKMNGTAEIAFAPGEIHGEVALISL